MSSLLPSWNLWRIRKIQQKKIRKFLKSYEKISFFIKFLISPSQVSTFKIMIHVHKKKYIWDEIASPSGMFRWWSDFFLVWLIFWCLKPTHFTFTMKTFISRNSAACSVTSWRCSHVREINTQSCSRMLHSFRIYYMLL